MDNLKYKISAGLIPGHNAIKDVHRNAGRRHIRDMLFSKA